jgi:hypothetical protein
VDPFYSDVASESLRRRHQTTPVIGGGIGHAIDSTSGLGGATGFGMLNPQDHNPVINFTNTPDYKKLIEGSSTYQMAKQGFDSQNLINASNRSAMIRRALAEYGKIPDFSGAFNMLDPVTGQRFLDEDVDQSTRDLAGQNTQSILSKLGNQHDTNLKNLAALMASKGILGSGQDALMQSEEGKGYASALDEAQKSLFDILQQAQQEYLNSYNQGQGNLQTAAQNAAAGLQGSGQLNPTNVSATLDPGYTYNGQAVYKDSNGNYWTAGGQAVSGGSLTSSQPTPPQQQPPARWWRWRLQAVLRSQDARSSVSPPPGAEPGRPEADVRSGEPASSRLAELPAGARRGVVQAESVDGRRLLHGSCSVASSF